MHYNRNVAPLLVGSLTQPVAIALLPVPMLHPRPSSEPLLFAHFFKPQGQRLLLHEDDTLRVRKYMQRNHTEALTSDGKMAFTLHGNQLLECDPQAVGQPTEPLLATFQALDWSEGDTVTPCGAAESVDITEVVLAMDPAAIAGLHDGGATVDALIDPEMRGHCGPYAVRAEQAIRAFFGVDRLDQVTAEMLQRKREGRLQAAAARLLDPEDPGRVWMMAVGPQRSHFTCTADDIDSALHETRKAFPGQPVSAACRVA